MVAYLKMGPQVRTYSDYLRAAREAEKEDTIELSQSPRAPATDGLSKPRATSFFPLRKLKGNHPFTKKPAMHLTQLEEEDTNDGKNPESDDPDGIDGVTEEFMVRLARVVKDTQVDEKHCYHCSSPEHFIRNCPLMKVIRDKKQLNRKKGTAIVKGAWTPLKPANATKAPNRRLRRHRTILTDSHLESGPVSMMVWQGKCGKGKDKWRKLHGPPRQWGTGKYHNTEVCKRTFPTSWTDN